MTSKPLKLTAAQRTALATIAGGGVVVYQPRYGSRESVTVPQGAREITYAVVRRLVGLNLADMRKLDPAGRPLAGTYLAVEITRRGADTLAGRVRPPIVAVTVVSIDGGPSWPITTEIDPYQWDAWRDKPTEQAHWLRIVSSRIVSERVTAVTTVDGAE